jgi:hypothetical protein
MANSFHLARTPKLRLAHHNRLPFRHGGPLANYILNPSGCARGSCAPDPFLPAASALVFASKRKVYNNIFFSYEEKVPSLSLINIGIVLYQCYYT